jgi:hypothetical protein
MKMREKNVSVVELMSGEYQAPALEIYSNAGARLAELEPIGTWILGALGRVDLKGVNDTEGFLYFAEGDPHLAVTIASEEEHPAPVFRNIEHAGWYWIENVRLGRARRLDSEIFVDLLLEVSDYGREFAAR